MANIARQAGTLPARGLYLSPAEAAHRTDCESISQVGHTLSRIKSISSADGMKGVRNAQLLYREIKVQGYTGSDTAWVALSPTWRALLGQARSFKQVEPQPQTMINPDEGKKKRPPTALQVAHWITFKEEQRLEWQKVYAQASLRDRSRIAHTYEHSRTLLPMLRER